MHRRVQVYMENKKIWDNIHIPNTSIKYAYSNDDEYNKFINQHIHIYNKTCIKVISKDTVDTGLEYIQNGCAKNPLLLNMADIYHPGGCVMAGGGMQEESIFRRSNYHKHLLNIFYPIQKNEAVYSPCISVFRTNEETLYQITPAEQISFVACPGISMPSLDTLTRCTFQREDELCFRRKIRLIFQIALKHNHDVLVLGALGCGAFSCPPKHVATIFKEELKNVDGIFSTVVFAVLGSSFHIFHDILEL